MGKVLGDRRGDLDMNQVAKLQDVQILQLNKKLKRLKVHVTHLPYRRKYVIEKLTAAPASRLTFGDPPMTVAQYFAQKYRPLRYPNLPCIEVGSKKNYIPVEVNAKLGGINNTIPQEVKTIVFDHPAIIMGADVTHPAPSEMNKPSIAAVVASVDRYAFRYIATFRIQKQNAVAKARIEIIEDMKNIAKDLLLSFYQINKFKPEKIIFYRDGVSEGQFSHVLQYEIAALREACTALESGYEPGITFLSVQKRHQTRFMPRNRSDGSGKHGNVPPGTVVDTVVTHPVDFDFFLCSHFGIQGTSRPAHYYVLWDDNDFKADTLQKLTYGLCHTYARCSRSVSIPTPVYYAHHATKRAKCYVDARTDSSDSGSSSSGSMLPTSILDDAVKIAKLMERKMFFI
ncbi:hypothetical protein HPB49_015224 [Dermacentor silvarum]|uniref:Uncharacterized protein n=1 Tax=Dermacentor silvarum TaxID=543639 RepID=A0ACB8CA42_DERSI|nr:hypothetical protein HPB49_015224 [Dermacentor silvarum]